MKQLINQAHDIYSFCYDPYGKIYSKLTGDIEARNIDKDKQQFILAFMGFLMESKVISDTTKMFIKSRASTIKAVVDSHNRDCKEHEKINVNTAISKLQYDKNKLDKMFDDNMITKVLYMKECNLAKYKEQLSIAVLQYDKRVTVLDKLAVHIPKDSLSFVCSDEDFDEILEVLAPYSPKTIKTVIQFLNDKGYSGYLTYLTSGKTLDSTEKSRLKDLETLLGEK